MFLDLEWLKNPTGAYGSEVYKTLGVFLKRNNTTDGNIFGSKLGEAIYPQMMDKLYFTKQKEIDDLYIEYIGKNISQRAKIERLKWLEKLLALEDASLASRIKNIGLYSIKTEQEKERFLIKEFEAHPRVTIASYQTNLAIANLIAVDSAWLAPLEKIIRQRSAAA